MRIFVLFAALALNGCALADHVVFDRYAAFLSGGTISEGQKGHRSGTGLAEFWIGKPPFQFCYDLSASRLEGVTAAHLHRAPPTAIGLVALTLEPPTDGRSSNCTRVSRKLIAEIKANPRAFYVDYHSIEFPEGAVRGQLEASSPDLRRPIS